MPRRANGEGSLIKLKGCRFWYAQFYDPNGRKIRISARTAVKQEALAILRKQMADRDRGLAPLSDVRKITYADLRAGLLASYVEKGNRSLVTRADGEETITGLKQLDDFFKYKASNPGPSVVQITTETGRAFVEQRKKEGAGNAVINRSLACLRRMLRVAHEDGKLQFVPVIRLLKEPAPRRGFLPMEKFEQLVRLLPTTLRPLITILYFCGVRVGEAVQIEWTQVDLGHGLIRLEPEQTKTGEARTVPLPSMLVMMLNAVKPKVGRVFDDTNLRKEWTKACVACGLARIIKVDGRPHDPRYEGLTIHDLRRSAIRNLVNAGVPERVAMKISGHQTRSVFDRYHIVNTDDVTTAMQRVEVAAAGLLHDQNGAKLGKKTPRTTRKSLMALSSRG